jgi:hypothetical protein
MVLVGSLNCIEASPLRIVYTAQKNQPNEAAVKMRPMDVERVVDRKFSGTYDRAKKPTASTSARSTGGWKATPA